MSKQIPLTQNQFAIVDDHWFEYLNQWKWGARWSENTQSYYAERREGKNSIQMARVIAKTPDWMICDHKNHDTLDNQENNLRNVTYSQNNMNKGVQKNNTLGLAGVQKRSDSGRYRARLRIGGESLLNKTFNTLEEAAQARKEAEEKYFGEFAYTGDQQ